MFPLDRAVRPVCHFSVLDIGLVVGIYALQDPSIVIAFGHLLEVTSNYVCSNDAYSEHVAVIHQQKAPC